MKRWLKILLFSFVLSIFTNIIFADNIIMSFRNQRFEDILYTLAEMEDKTLNLDETVAGSTSFNFNDADFDTALERFADVNGLFIEKKDNVYNVSKIKVVPRENSRFDVSAEEVNITAFIRKLSRETNVSIMSDSLPNVTVTVRMNNAEIRDIIDTILYKTPGYQYEEMRGGYYIYRMSGSSQRINNDSYKITESDGLYTVEIQRSASQALINALFKKANKEYILLVRPTMTLENMKYENRTFNEVLKIIFTALNLDFKIKDDVYYIFEVQKRDILKQLKDTKTIRLENITVDKLISILPAELSASSLMKTDKFTNTIYLTGSETEIEPIENFIISSDVPYLSGSWKRFDLKNTTADVVIPLIPKDYLYSDCISISGSNAFITLTTADNENKLKSFIDSVDNKDKTYAIKLNYIKSDDLIKNLPPSVKKENVYTTNDLGMVFFTGTDSGYNDFIKELAHLDKPSRQIRYQILVLQRQKTDSYNWGSGFNLNSASKSDGGTYSFASTLSNIFNINFDIIAKFGMQFAGSLNAEISNGLSHVLADTTLNGLSGEKVKFSNTSTYRYRDVVIEGTTSRYTTTTREITSGLTLDIDGWVSGDDMITVNVNAGVSKQSASGSSSSSTTDQTNPPSTTQKSVSTTVRTKSGEPVIIGGLLQSEEDSSESRTPGLGAIPVVGNLFKTSKANIVDTEFVIYLVPFAEKYETSIRDVNKNINRYYNKYVMGESTL